MHLRYLVLVVANSMAVTTLAESAKSVAMTLPPLVPSPLPLDRDKNLTNSVDVPALVGVPDEEKTLSKTLSSFSWLYKAIHGDVRWSRSNGIFASGLDAMKRRLWLLGKETPESVYHKLHLSQVRDENLLESLSWKTWAVYVAQLNHPVDPATSIARAMLEQVGDLNFVSILVNAAKKDSTKEMAALLMEKVHETWIGILLTSAKVFEVLKLKDSAGNLFGSDLYAVWLEYLKRFNAQETHQQVTELKVLRKFFDNASLVERLTAADAVDNPSSLRILLEFVPLWVKKKTDPEFVFETLMLNENLLTKYLEQNSVAFQRLRDQFKTVTDVKNWREFVVKTRKEQIAPDHVLQMLLEKDADESPLLRVWIDYIKAYHKEKLLADPMIRTLKRLGSTSSRTSQTILREIVTSWVEENVYTEDVFKMLMLNPDGINAYFAKNGSKNKQQRSWFAWIPNDSHFRPQQQALRQGVTTYKKEYPDPEQVFEVLLNGDGDASPFLHIWVSYMKEYLEVKPVVKSMIKTFEILSAADKRGEPTSHMILCDFVSNWMKTQAQPEHIFKMLRLGKDKDKEASQLQNIWMMYVKEYLNQNPADAPDMIQKFKLLSTADNGVAMRLDKLRAVVTEWVENQPHPEEAIKWLMLDRDGDARRLLNVWVGCMDDYLEKKGIKDPLSIKMLGILSFARHAGHQRSREILREYEGQWLIAGKSPKSVFEELMPGQMDIIEVIDNPVLVTFKDYLSRFNFRTSDKATLAGTLLDVYQELKLAIMLQEATNAQDESIAKVAKAWQAEQFQRWVHEKVTPPEVFDWLTIREPDNLNIAIQEAYRSVYNHHQEILMYDAALENST